MSHSIMRRKITWRDVIGLLKDKASLTKAAFVLSKSKPSTVRLAVVRATTHTPPTPPSDRRLSSLLHLGDGSRATASALITSLMDRLHRTSNSIVALKCLLIIHHVIKRGPFILQDQLSVISPSSGGGQNHLKLTSFHDGASAATWRLSAWVRWYACYVETLLSACRVLGYYFLKRINKKERIGSLMNVDLIKDVDSLVASVEETCKVPDYNSLFVEDNNITTLLKEIMALMYGDYVSIINEVLSRVNELHERQSCLNLSESIELASIIKRLRDCKKRLMDLYVIRKPSIEKLWGLVEELKRDTTIGGGAKNQLSTFLVVRG